MDEVTILLQTPGRQLTQDELKQISDAIHEQLDYIGISTDTAYLKVWDSAGEPIFRSKE